MSRILFDAFDGVTPLVNGVGPAGAATFALYLESGTRVTYTWETDAKKFWAGNEQRVCVIGAPRQSYEGSVLLSNAQVRLVHSALVKNAALAQPFLLGLSFEELTVSADAGSTSVPVYSTASCDWANPGQRVVILARDGVTTATGVIQSASGSAILLDTNVSAVAKAGARIMPAMAVYLDSQQAFSRYAINIDEWGIKARAALYGFAGVLTMGVGASLATYAGMSIWDRGLESSSQVSQPLLSGAELEDLGGIVANIPSYSVADWGRQVRLESASIADWQWLKAFLATVRGRQCVFLLPTWQPDLVPLSDASTGTLTIQGLPASDYAGQWFASLAHRRLMIRLASGTIAYRTVTTAGDNGDGTQSLGLDSTLAGAIAAVSFLETCRFDSDEFVVTFNGSTFSVDLTARVVQQ